MKDYIDVGFMKLFDPRYLFKDYPGLNEPDEKGEILELEKRPIIELTDKIRGKVAEMEPLVAA